MTWSGLERFHTGDRILVGGMERIWVERQEENNSSEGNSRKTMTHA